MSTCIQYLLKFLPQRIKQKQSYGNEQQAREPIISLRPAQIFCDFVTLSMILMIPIKYFNL